MGVKLSKGFLATAGVSLLLFGMLGGVLMARFSESDALPNLGAGDLVTEGLQLGKRTFRPAGDEDTTLSPAMAEAVSLNTLFREVSRMVTPAVVYIDVEAGGKGAPEWLREFERQQPEGGGFHDDLPRQSVGSGVIISHDGYIVTNHHVVEAANVITVTLTDKRQLPARVVGLDPATDLAVIRIDGVSDLPTIGFGDSDNVQVGDWVLAVGNPFRLTSTVTAGIVSALGRQVNIIDDTFGIEDFIQTDAAINPGNSGGALVNLRGQLVGIATAIATEGGSYEGYGFAVPVNLMDRVARDLIAYGEVRRGFMGVSIQEISSGDARRLGLTHVGGVFLEEVQQHGAAARAGLLRGDVVLSIGGRAVNAPNELQRTIARYRPGDHLNVVVWRRGEQHTFDVTLLGREDPSYRDWFAELRGGEPEGGPDNPHTPPGEALPNFELARWGVGLRALSARERDAFEVAEGAYIAYVTRDGAAEKAGLPRDVVITAIGDEAVRGLPDVVRALEREAAREDAVLLRVKRRDGIAAFYEVEAPAKR